MLQYTWCIPFGDPFGVSFDDSGQPHSVFLGSSLAGYDWRHELTGTRKTAMRHVRFGLVDGHPLQHAGYNFDNSLMIEQRWLGGTRFGNCAETYPFLDLLMYVLRFFFNAVSTANWCLT